MLVVYILEREANKYIMPRTNNISVIVMITFRKLCRGKCGFNVPDAKKWAHQDSSQCTRVRRFCGWNVCCLTSMLEDEANTGSGPIITVHVCKTGF